MFNNDQTISISEAIAGTWLLVNNQAISEVALDIFLEDVEGFPFSAVMTAIRNARKHCKNRISIGDIMGQLENLDGRPSADEAWGIASQTLDENVTVVWTTETAEAWGIASPLLDMGDKFSAARAFKEKYEKLVSASRDNRLSVNWVVNAGTDIGSRKLAVEEALAKNLITPSYALTFVQDEKIQAGAYQALKNNVTQMIEYRETPLDKVLAIKSAGEKLQSHIAELKKAAGIVTEERPDRTKCKRDSLAIFEEAEAMGVFTSQFEKKHWCAKAANGEDLRELQILILAKKSSQQKAGAA